jgi:hypothetical protein
MTKWIKRWNTWISSKPSMPGVWRRKEGGYLVRGRISHPITGKTKEIRFSVIEARTPSEAFAKLQEEREQARLDLEQPAKSMPLFADFAVSLLEEKVNDGSIASAATRVKWGSILEKHLVPAFGTMLLNELRHVDVMTWRSSVAKRIHAGDYSPNTANDWLSVMRVIMKAGRRRHELEHHAMDGVDNFDTRLHQTYTEEEPNSLTADEVPVFLSKLLELHPEVFAFVTLGFTTGWRPSTLRPLRRKGPTPDVLWDQQVVLVRRSHTEGKEVMDAPKTKRRQRVNVPAEILDVLRWHADRLPTGPMRDSDLLFPGADGGLLDRGCLRIPFEDVSKALKLQKRITPIAMRRTFQDLARAANVNDLVTRSISGHATEAMQHHYSTVNQDEVRSGLAKVISITGAHRAVRELEESGGMHGGMHGHKTTSAG